MSNMLEVKDLKAYYGPSQALHGISFSLSKGGITTLLGANGAGKTTTLRAICGMVRAEGSVIIDGEPVTGKATESVVRLGVGHVPEGRGTFTELSVEENLRVAAYTRRDKAAAARDLEMVFTYFPRLKERMAQQAGTLSGGEQQMLVIARALMARPSVLLLDEPSLGLAPAIVERIFEMIETLKTSGLTILLVEQNVNQALAVADRAYVMRLGAIVASGTAEEIRSTSDLSSHYLGG